MKKPRLNAHDKITFDMNAAARPELAAAGLAVALPEPQKLDGLDEACPAAVSLPGGTLPCLGRFNFHAPSGILWSGAHLPPAP
ncbi:MAG: hypothetical protein V4675_07290 [Verrucomicrobiota bacterium]